jgi:hypothetical protein
MLRRVALVRTDVLEELSAPFIGVTKIGELGTTLAVTSNRSTLRGNSVTLMMKEICSSETSVVRRATWLTSQKTAFFIVTTLKTSNLT